MKEARYDGTLHATILIQTLKRSPAHRLAYLCLVKVNKPGCFRGEYQNGIITTSIDHMIRLCVQDIWSERSDTYLRMYIKDTLLMISRTDIVRALISKT